MTHLGFGASLCSSLFLILVGRRVFRPSRVGSLARLVFCIFRAACARPPRVASRSGLSSTCRQSIVLRDDEHIFWQGGITSNKFWHTAYGKRQVTFAVDLLSSMR